MMGDSSFTWLTRLTLANSDLPRGELLRLRDIPNLVSLYVHSSSRSDESLVGDGILKGWSRMAREAGPDGPFSRLRCLALHGQTDVTMRSMEILDDFPRLGFFLPSKCGFEAGECGRDSNWRVAMATIDDDSDSAAVESRAEDDRPAPFIVFVNQQINDYLMTRSLGRESILDVTMGRESTTDRDTLLRLRGTQWLERRTFGRSRPQSTSQSSAMPAAKRRKIRESKEMDMRQLLDL